MKTPEDLLRENVRALISLVKKKNEKRSSEEQQLRSIIREFIQYELKEAATPDNDPAPHKSTGINVLEDLLKKIIPQIEDDYKLLTTSEEQRDSYRAHIIQAVVQTLKPVEVNNAAPDDEAAQGIEEEIDIQIDDEDKEDDMFIDIRGDKEKEAEEDKEEEEDPRDSFGIQGKDTTGRNMAYNTFKKIETQIIDSYDMLSNPEDQEIFFDYLIANLKLYFDKFENEIQPNVKEPTNQAYSAAKQDQPAEENGDEVGGGEEELDLEI
jgi:pyruvate-formate lyase